MITAKKLALFCAFGFGISQSNSALADDNCPTLTLQNIAEAACSKDKGFHVGKMNYYATTACPTGVGIKKWFQSFKAEQGTKLYAPIKSMVTQKARVRCNYSIPRGWSAITKNGAVAHNLELFAEFDNIDKMASWEDAPCQNITREAYNASLAKEGSIELQTGQDVVGTFKPADENVVFGVQGKHFLGGDVGALKSGKAAFTKQLKVSCEYKYKPGQTETTFTLDGSTLFSYVHVPEQK